MPGLFLAIGIFSFFSCAPAPAHYLEPSPQQPSNNSRHSYNLGNEIIQSKLSQSQIDIYAVPGVYSFDLFYLTVKNQSKNKDIIFDPIDISANKVLNSELKKMEYISRVEVENILFYQLRLLGYNYYPNSDYLKKFSMYKEFFKYKGLEYGTLRPGEENEGLIALYQVDKKDKVTTGILLREVPTQKLELLIPVGPDTHHFEFILSEKPKSQKIQQTLLK